MLRHQSVLAKLVFLFFLLTSPDSVVGQYQLKGKVLDGVANFPISAASVQIIGSNQGTISNSEGTFSIWVDSYPVSLNIRHIGYSSATIRLVSHSTQTRIFQLEPETLQLGEVTISDEDPAISIMRKVLERKKDMRSLMKSYETDSYTRFFLYRQKNRQNALIQVKERIGKSFWRDDKGERAYVQAQRTIPAESGIFRFVDARAASNLYDDTINIFGTEYLGPTHPNALQHYTFKFGEKKSVDGQTVYEIYVSPKSATRSALVGRIRILDEDYVMLDAKLTPNSFAPPIEPIRDFEINLDQQFAEFEKGIWLPINLSLNGWLEFGRSGVNYPRASFRQETRLTRHLVNGSTPDSLFDKSERVTFDPLSKFRAFLFEETSDFIQLTDLEARGIEQIRPELELADEFVPQGLLAGYVGIPVVEKDPNRGPGPWYTRPAAWYNRVDGFRLGLGHSVVKFQNFDLHYEAGLGFSRLRPDFKIGIQTSIFKNDALGWDLDISARDQLENNLPFSKWTKYRISIPTYLGSPDVFDYYRAQGLIAESNIKTGPAELQLGTSIDAVSGVERNAAEDPWLYGDLRLPNPNVGSRTLVGVFSKLGVTLADQLPRGTKVDLTGFFKRGFDTPEGLELATFNAVSLRGHLSIPTFSFRRSVPSSLVIELGWDKLSGEVPEFYRVGLDTSILRFSSHGIFSSRNELFLSGKQAAFISWEKRMETLPFEWLRLYAFSDRGMGLSVFGNHGWLDRERIDLRVDEWGIRLHRILGYPIQLQLSREFSQGHWIFGFGWRR